MISTLKVSYVSLKTYITIVYQPTSPSINPSSQSTSFVNVVWADDHTIQKTKNSQLNLVLRAYPKTDQTLHWHSDQSINHTINSSIISSSVLVVDEPSNWDELCSCLSSKAPWIRFGDGEPLRVQELAMLSNAEIPQAETFTWINQSIHHVSMFVIVHVWTYTHNSSCYLIVV